MLTLGVDGDQRDERDHRGKPGEKQREGHRERHGAGLLFDSWKKYGAMPSSQRRQSAEPVRGAGLRQVSLPPLKRCPNNAPREVSVAGDEW